MSAHITPAVECVRASRAAVRASNGVTGAHVPDALRDLAIRRISLCAEPWLAPAVREVDPGATHLTEWADFVAAYPQADVTVLLPSEASERELAAGLRRLSQAHRLPSVIVVTQLDVEHLLLFRRTPVDEFVALASMARDLPAAVLRSVIDPLRERLAQHLEGLEHCRRELRFALARALRHPRRIATVRQLAAAERVTPRTLENQWNAVRGGAAQTGLADLLWSIRLLAVLELRAKGTTVDGISQRLEVERRSVQRACRRQLGTSLGRVSPVTAISELLRLRRRIADQLRGVETACELR